MHMNDNKIWTEQIPEDILYEIMSAMLARLVEINTEYNRTKNEQTHQELLKISNIYEDLSKAWRKHDPSLLFSIPANNDN
jgi:hypothetical protein